MKTFKELRTENGISLVHVAKRLGITTQTLRLKERGITEFTASEVRYLCGIYGVKFEDVNIIPTK